MALTIDALLVGLAAVGNWLKKAYGSAFSRTAPSAPLTANLYKPPSATSGTNKAQMPLSLPTFSLTLSRRYM